MEGRREHVHEDDALLKEALVLRAATRSTMSKRSAHVDAQGVFHEPAELDQQQANLHTEAASRPQSAPWTLCQHPHAQGESFLRHHP